MKKFFIVLAKILVILFALIGFAFSVVFVAMKVGLTKTAGLVDTQNDFWNEFKNRPSVGSGQQMVTKAPLGTWTQSDEWAALQVAIVKDKPAILKASSDANIEPRVVVAQIVAEQLRLFTSERDIFKSIFQPLRVLGTQTQFSLGVTGVKEETAQKIEEHLSDISSPFYLGETYAHLLDYSTPATSDMRIARFSDIHDHYYSYLYAALFLREVSAQWKAAGFDISNRPEILSTLFNLGFDKSIPKANPVVGGAPIEINGETYTFGGLAGEFYYSNELLGDFPRTGN